jgi:hypothetical protein
MSSKVEFMDELPKPPKGPQQEKYGDAIAALRKNPGVWGLIHEANPDESRSHDSVSGTRSHLKQHYPDLEFSVRTVNDVPHLFGRSPGVGKRRKP